VRSRSSRRRKRSWYVIWSLIFFFFAASLLALLISLPIWQIQKIEVQGVRLLSGDEIQRLAGIPLMENIFLVRFGGARGHLEGIPVIQRVDFLRRLPDTLIINVTERREVAVAVLGNDSVLIDDEGVILNRFPVYIKFPDISGLPVIYGLREDWIEGYKLRGHIGEEMIALLKELKNFISPTKLQIDVSNLEEMGLRVDDTLQVKLGAARQIAEKIGAFEILFNKVKDRKLSIEYIDVRYPQFPVIRFK